MSGGGYGQQGWGQTGGNMGAPTPSPMESAFAPRTGATEGWGGGQNALLTGQYPGSAPPLASTGMYAGGLPPMRNPDFNPSNPWRGSLPGGGGWDAGIEPPGVLTGTDPSGAQVGGNMGGAMGKMGGGVNPLQGMATTNPVGGLMGGGQAGGSPGNYQDYMNRRNAWIDQLRGYVMPPQAIGGGGQSPVAPAPGSPAPPRGNPPPGTPRTPGSAPQPTKAAGPDHLANFKQLLAEDPSGRLASEYRLRSGDTIGWWQNQMQGGNAPGLLGGDTQLLDFMRNTSPVSSNSAPLTTQEMMRLNQMAGIRGPSWLK